MSTHSNSPILHVRGFWYLLLAPSRALRFTSSDQWFLTEAWLMCTDDLDFILQEPLVCTVRKREYRP